MSYIFFNDNDDFTTNSIDDIVDFVAPIFQVNSSNIGRQCKNYKNNVSNIFETKSDLELLFEYYLYNKEINSFVCVYHLNKIENDKDIIKKYGENYLGTAESEINREELIKVIKILKKRLETLTLKNYFYSNLIKENENDYLNLTDREKNRLFDIHNMSQKPFLEWCDNRINEIDLEFKSFPKFFKRDF